MSNITLITQAAEAKFGRVIEVQQDVLLIQRESGLSCAPLDRYMTIKGAMIDGVPAFHAGDYDMSLIAASKNFAMRANIAEQLEKIEADKKLLIEENLVEFLNFFEEHIDNEITEGAHLSDLTSSDSLDNLKEAFLSGKKLQSA